MAEVLVVDAQWPRVAIQLLNVPDDEQDRRQAAKQKSARSTAEPANSAVHVPQFNA